MLRLVERFHGRIQVVFGWGTNLTNDVGFQPLSLVVKAIRACGHATVKLCDNLDKAIGTIAHGATGNTRKLSGANSAPGTQARLRPGRDRRKAASKLAAAKLVTNAILTQNIGNSIAAARSGRGRSRMTISSAAPEAPQAIAAA